MTTLEQIEEIEAIINAGITEATTPGGGHIRYDLKTLAARAQDLRRQIPTRSDYKRVVFRG